MKTLKELFLGELADIYDAERQLVKAMPKMAKAATCTHLQIAIMGEAKDGHLEVAGAKRLHCRPIGWLN